MVESVFSLNTATPSTPELSRSCNRTARCRGPSRETTGVAAAGAATGVACAGAVDGVGSIGSATGVPDEGCVDRVSGLNSQTVKSSKRVSWSSLTFS